jgi:hypothetical protein
MKRYIEANLISHMKFLLRLYTNRSHSPVFIYQPGKTGSSSLVAALTGRYPGVVLHDHAFSRNHARSKDFRNKAALYRWYADGNRPLKVICPIREPLGRNISMFFDQITTRPHWYGVDNKNFSPTLNNMALTELKEIFIEKFRHEHVFQWLDLNILENFHIDVYSKPFPSRGYEVYDFRDIRVGELKAMHKDALLKPFKHVTVLLLRSNLRDEIKEKIISDYLQIDRINIKNANEGAARASGEVYRQFVKQVSFDREFVNQYTSSRFFRHFYGCDCTGQLKPDTFFRDCS